MTTGNGGYGKWNMERINSACRYVEPSETRKPHLTRRYRLPVNNTQIRVCQVETLRWSCLLILLALCMSVSVLKPYKIDFKLRNLNSLFELHFYSGCSSVPSVLTASKVVDVALTGTSRRRSMWEAWSVREQAPVAHDVDTEDNIQKEELSPGNWMVSKFEIETRGRVVWIIMWVRFFLLLKMKKNHRLVSRYTKWNYALLKKARIPDISCASLCCMGVVSLSQSREQRDRHLRL